MGLTPDEIAAIGAATGKAFTDMPETAQREADAWIARTAPSLHDYRRASTARS